MDCGSKSCSWNIPQKGSVPARNKKRRIYHAEGSTFFWHFKECPRLEVSTPCRGIVTLSCFLRCSQLVSSRKGLGWSPGPSTIAAPSPNFFVTAFIVEHDETAIIFTVSIFRDIILILIIIDRNQSHATDRLTCERDHSTSLDTRSVTMRPP